MSRLFNVEVFNQTTGKDPVYSSSDFNELLGSADTMLVQIIVDAVTQANTVVSVYYQTNNTTQEQLWTSGAATTVTVTTIDDAPEQGVMTLPSTNGAGAFGRFQVTATKSGATVRIVACGRGF